MRLMHCCNVVSFDHFIRAGKQRFRHKFTLQELLSRAKELKAKLEEMRKRARLRLAASLPTERAADGGWALVKEIERYRGLGGSLAKLRPAFGERLDALLADSSPLTAALSVADQFEKTKLDEAIVSALRQAPIAEQRRNELSAAASVLAASLERCRTAWAAFVGAANLDKESFFDNTELLDFSSIAARLDRALSEEFGVADWMQYHAARQAIAQSRAAPIATAFDDAGAGARLADAFELALIRALVRSQLGGEAKGLAELGGATLDEARARFASLDREINDLEARRIAAIVQRREIDYGNDRGPRYRAPRAIAQRSPPWPDGLRRRTPLGYWPRFV
jgi:hypothetical protein